MMLEPILKNDTPYGVEQEKQPQAAAYKNQRIVVSFSRHAALLGQRTAGLRDSEYTRLAIQGGISFPL